MPRKPGIPKVIALDELTKQSRVGREPRPLKIPKHSIRPVGPKEFKLGTAPGAVGYGPGEPPPGFLNQWNSRTEWLYYWAVCKVKHSPLNCRQPPFVGGGEGDWTYQNPDPVFGGRQVGGQVFDLVVWQGAKKIALRIQTERFHVFAPAATQAKDYSLKIHATSVDDIVDIYDQNAIADKSGRAAIMQVVKALKGVRELDPIRAGVARRVRAD